MIGPFVLKNENSCDDFLQRDRSKQNIEDISFFFSLIMP
jgi:hypothetical protein